MMSNVHNVMEDLVEEKLDTCIAKAGICSCELCRADVMARALSRLPARYASRLQGSLYARIDSMRRQAATDVLAAVTEAINVVGDNPRHSGTANE